MSSPRITYTPRSDTTPEREIAALADVYEFVVSCGQARRAEEKKNAAEGSHPGGDDAKEGSENDFRANSKYT